MKIETTAMELKMRNLSLRIKCSFSKPYSALFCPALFYFSFIRRSSHQWDYVTRTEMRKLLSENNFFKNTCYLISHVDINEINISPAWKVQLENLYNILKMNLSDEVVLLSLVFFS